MSAVRFSALRDPCEQARRDAREEQRRSNANRRRTSVRTPVVWTDQEKDRIVTIIREHGRDWRKLKEAFPQRTLQQIKTFYHVRPRAVLPMLWLSGFSALALCYPAACSACAQGHKDKLGLVALVEAAQAREAAGRSPPVALKSLLLAEVAAQQQAAAQLQLVADAKLGGGHGISIQPVSSFPGVATGLQIANQSAWRRTGQIPAVGASVPLVSPDTEAAP